MSTSADPAEDLAAKLIVREPAQSQHQPQQANQAPTTSSQLEEDHNSRLLTNDFFQDSVYNDCTVPMVEPKSGIFAKTTQITACFIPLASTSRPADNNGPAKSDPEQAAILAEGGSQEGAIRAGEHRVRFADNNPDVFQSINNLRINVNNHIAGGSKSALGRLRAGLGRLKLQDQHRALDLTIICSIALLLLYLIYKSSY